MPAIPVCLYNFYQTNLSLQTFPLSGGGAGLHHLLAAVPHRQKPFRPGGRLRNSHAEPELQHGLHGSLLP